jgi:asparagine synthase (glutamine-hydrolysing)
MCGICGIVDAHGPGSFGAALKRMLAALTHRGPDDEGMLIAPPAAPDAALGMRRLSIIDVPGGHQPIYNETADVAVFFNGEIYNFRALRAELESTGHRFSTKSDTEVIVHAYEEWGEDCLQRLRGMFALALLDMRSAPRLLLARDRLGIKPLYYAVVHGALIFASEVRALLASRRVSRKISPDALDSYLLFGSVGEPMTLVDGVFSIPPGHFASIPAGAPVRDVRPAPYWSIGEALTLKVAPKDAPKLDSNVAALGPAARGLRPLLERVVNEHLIADVPLGVFLSSGLDSTALVALASRNRPGLHTFTVVFEDLEFSEAELARAIARRFGTQHQEIPLDAGEMLEHLEEAVSALDQPSMDGINTYFVSRAAHSAGLKVAISGLGGDEVFGGYSTFSAGPRATRLADLGRKLPRTLRAATAPAVGRAGAGRGDAGRKLGALWRNADALPHPYFFMRLLYTPAHVAALRGARELRNSSAPWRIWLEGVAHQTRGLDPFATVSCLEARSYMVNTLLRDTDSVSMAHSLEVRVPMLDHMLLEFVTRLPAAAKMRRGVNKALLVESLKDVLPPEVVHQRKRTFTLPWERWLRGSLEGRMSAGLNELAPALAPHMDANAVRAVWMAFADAKTSWSRPWSLYVLNQWCRAHLDSQAVAEVPTAAAAV